MSKALAKLDNLSVEQAQLLEEHKEHILAYDRGMDQSWQTFSAYSYLCGRRLLLAKEVFPHGNSEKDNAGFMKWVESCFPNRSYRTMTNRMMLAEAVQPKLETVSNFNKAIAQLEQSPTNDGASKVIADALHDVMDGKKVTEFLRSEQKIREKEKQKHTPPKELTPEEQLEAQIEQAIAPIKIAMQGISDCKTTQAELNPKLPKKWLKELSAMMVDYNKILRPLLKGEKKGAKKK